MKININKDTAKEVAYFVGNISTSVTVGTAIGVLVGLAQPNPIVKGVCVVGAGIIGGMVGKEAGKYAEEYVDTMLDTVDDFQHRSEEAI